LISFAEANGDLDAPVTRTYATNPRNS